MVKVTYNANVLSTRALLEHFFERHDPTQENRQGNDVGTQYRSIILYNTSEQLAEINKVKSVMYSVIVCLIY